MYIRKFSDRPSPFQSRIFETKKTKKINLNSLDKSVENSLSHNQPQTSISKSKLYPQTGSAQELNLTEKRSVQKPIVSRFEVPSHTNSTSNDKSHNNLDSRKLGLKSKGNTDLNLYSCFKNFNLAKDKVEPNAILKHKNTPIQIYKEALIPRNLASAVSKADSKSNKSSQKSIEKRFNLSFHKDHTSSFSRGLEKSKSRVNLRDNSTKNIQKEQIDFGREDGRAQELAQAKVPPVIIDFKLSGEKEEGQVKKNISRPTVKVFPQNIHETENNRHFFRSLKPSKNLVNEFGKGSFLQQPKSIETPAINPLSFNLVSEYNKNEYFPEDSYLQKTEKTEALQITSNLRKSNIKSSNQSLIDEYEHQKDEQTMQNDSRLKMKIKEKLKKLIILEGKTGSNQGQASRVASCGVFRVDSMKALNNSKSIERKIHPGNAVESLQNSLVNSSLLFDKKSSMLDSWKLETPKKESTKTSPVKSMLKQSSQKIKINAIIDQYSVEKQSQIISERTSFRKPIEQKQIFEEGSPYRELKNHSNVHEQGISSKHQSPENKLKCASKNNLLEEKISPTKYSQNRKLDTKLIPFSPTLNPKASVPITFQDMSTNGRNQSVRKPIQSSGLKKQSPNSSSSSDKKDGRSASFSPYDFLNTQLKHNHHVKKMSKKIKYIFEKNEKSASGKSMVFETFPECYEIRQQIGKGCFGTVHIASQKLTNLPVALKVIPKNCVKNQTNQKIVQEINFLKTVANEQYLAKLFEVFEDEKNIYIALEYYPNGDLITFFKDRELLHEDQLKQLFLKIVLGVDRMHKLNIIHRDIKMDNILLDRNFDPILCDFGISSIYDPSKPIMDTGGTPAYLAPEVIKAQGEIGFKTDVWGLGILLYALAFGYVPFEGNDIQDLYRAILVGKFSFPSRHSCSQDLIDLISGMIIVDVRKRFSIKDVMQHKWMSKQIKIHQAELSDRKILDKKTERNRKDAVIRYLNDVGFGMDFIYDSQNARKFNHVTSCFENLIRNLQANDRF